MIDRAARNQAAVLLQGFRDGLILTTELDISFPQSAVDRALHSIRSRITSLFCSDYSSYTLAGRHRPSAEGLAFLDRCLAFLKSDREYEWKRDPWTRSPAAALQRVLTLGLANSIAQREEQGIQAQGDPDAWPYLDLVEYEEDQRRTA